MSTDPACRNQRRRLNTSRSPMEDYFFRDWKRPSVAPIGDQERRVHGSVLFGVSGLEHLERRVNGGVSFGAASPSFVADHARGEASSAEFRFNRLFLDTIERSIVLPMPSNPSARELFAYNARRLENYIAAAENLLQHRAADFGRLHERAKCLLDTVMSSLAMEFCQLRVWRPGAIRDHQGMSAAFIRECVRPRCSGGSASSASWSTSSDPFTGPGSGSGSGSSNDAYHAVQGLGEDLSVRNNDAFSGVISYMDVRSLCTLEDIPAVIREGGYEHMLRAEFHRRCDELARHVEVLDIDNILGGLMEEPKEELTKVWILAARIIISALFEMRRQLNGQQFFNLNRLKEDYFMAVAKVYVTKLLNSANYICTHVGIANNDPSSMDSDAVEIKHALSQLQNTVLMLQALKNSMLGISPLFSGQTKELILAEGEGIIHGLSAMLRKLFLELNSSVRSQHLVIDDTGVHRVTRHIMVHVGILVQQKMNGNLGEFAQLIRQLVSSLEDTLEISSRSLSLQGQQQVFLLNNVHFMVEQAKNTDVGLFLGESWLSQRHGSLDGYTEGYVEASWTPVMASFETRRMRVPEILWPHQPFDKFTSSFETTCSLQNSWKVTDPGVRQKLREAIRHKVIPLYQMHMASCSESKQGSAKYSIEQVQSQLLEMFEW